ncbi:MAG: hypothetical protein ACOYN0_17920 [Phycisphaerales bacterium]
MSQSLFDPDALRALPLWAAVHVASRAVRRIVLLLPARAGESPTALLLAACDAADRSASRGSRDEQDAFALARGASALGPAPIPAVAEAVRWLSDAAHAATDALDFSAAEAACRASVLAALDAARSPYRLVGMTAIQPAIFIASDVDQLTFACGELRVGTYDALPRGVFERLIPVRKPEVTPPDLDDPMRDDPTGGAR